MTSQPTKRSSRSAWVSELPNLPPSSEEQVRLPDTYGLGGVRLRHPGRSPEVLQRRAQVPRREHLVLVAWYCHTPIIAGYW